MKKKFISKLAKLKIISYSFIILSVVAIAGSIITHFVGNVAKYWLDFITYNYFAFMFFFLLVIFLLIISDIKGRAKAIPIISLIIIGIVWWFVFMNLALTLDKDIYVMLTGSYSEANGQVVEARVKHSKNTSNIEVVVHDKKKNQNITITFLDQYSSSIFKIGDNIKVKYLPHSFRGISYSNG